MVADPFVLSALSLAGWPLYQQLEQEAYGFYGGKRLLPVLAE
jgi:hypothetical protein